MTSKSCGFGESTCMANLGESYFVARWTHYNLESLTSGLYSKGVFLLREPFAFEL